MWLKSISGCFLLALQISVYSQTAPDRYFLKFTDKAHNSFSLDRPEEFLSKRALERRAHYKIPLKYNDLPVSEYYIDSLRSLGIKIINISKWFNAVTIFSRDTLLLDTIDHLSFVKDPVRNIPIKSIKQFKSTEPVSDKFEIINPTTTINYGYATHQIEMLNGQLLHQQGFTGKNMVIAVIDAGFTGVDKLPVFDSLWNRGQILGWHDFVKDGISVFQAHPHGMYVLSLMGGNIPNVLVGTAPDAGYWLLRSENGSSEYLTEEDNWVAAAEFADSAGADIINTSLGYSLFDNPLQDHSYQDMNGKTTRISIGANIAASKGMLVVVSAGNEGRNSWHYITTPADADSVLAVGAVNSEGIIASFSSVGPTSDGRLKPNVCAMGQGTFIEGIGGNIVTGNGTSLSAPLITGMAACLWQANPIASNMDIFKTIEESASLYPDSNFIYGYGIPDFNKANYLLSKEIKNDTSIAGKIQIFPNPFHSYFYLELHSNKNLPIQLEIYDLYGKLVFTGKYISTGRFSLLTITDAANLPKGIYLARVKTVDKDYTQKVIKF